MILSYHKMANLWSCLYPAQLPQSIHEKIAADSVKHNLPSGHILCQVLTLYGLHKLVYFAQLIAKLN